MSQVEAALRRAVASALDRIDAAGVEAVVEPSARPEFGDWSTPAPLRAAAVLRRPPMVIAEELHTLLEESMVEHVAGWSVTAPGYVNARLDPTSWAPAVIASALALHPSRPLIPDQGLTVAGRTLIEHTNINTNKAAHVGHLRNACLGDTVARILRRTGHEVEVNNYIDDTGVQVADVVVGLQHLGLTPRENEQGDGEPRGRRPARHHAALRHRV
jgi:arginyl-tRNA synthetase